MVVRSSTLPKLIFAASLLLLFINSPLDAQTPPADAATAVALLADVPGDFRAQGATRTNDTAFDAARQEDFQVVSSASRSYVSADGQKYEVTVAQTRSNSAAYALLSVEQKMMRQGRTASGPVAELAAKQIVSLGVPEQLAFIKGAWFVVVSGSGESKQELATLLADRIDGEVGAVPVLVQHLPEWETARARAVYAVSLRALQTAAGAQQPVLAAVSFEGGAEAVTADYGNTTQLVIVEYTTPQFAADNDRAVAKRIQELRDGGNGQNAPSSYRRVGNYLVFVFGAPDEQAAARLMGGVKYEKEVRWLGENPYAFERAQQSYTRMTLGIVIATFKATGLAIVLCVGFGGLVGGFVFLRRRAQSATSTAYSDAGGMVRLNLDDLNPSQRDPSRLLDTGKQ